MGHTRRNTPFRKMSGERREVSLSRRAEMRREELSAFSSFVEIDEEANNHPYSDEYESGDITMVKSHAF